MNYLNAKEKCHECGLRSKGFFCRLPDDYLTGFEALAITKIYTKGTTLFTQGLPANGVFMLCQGKVKLSTCSQDGKIIILDIAEPGDLLGLSAVIGATDYETTAEVLESCMVHYVEAADFLRFLKNRPEACLNAARQLSRNYQTAYRQVCALGLSDSVSEKLARLFLSWSHNGNGNGNGNGNDVHGPIWIKNSFTHAEMAEMIGTSRETVTRALKYFRDTELITVKDSHFIIHDRQRLKIAAG